MLSNWEKYRAVLDGGKSFVLNYLRKYSSLETDTDFNTRRDISYNPSHAKALIFELRNAISEKSNNIIRENLPQTYSDANDLTIRRGVDLEGNTINSFFNYSVTSELMGMGRTGILVDSPEFTPLTRLDEKESIPYLINVRAENILNWRFQGGKLVALRLMLFEESFDDTTQLILDTTLPRIYEYRLTDAGVTRKDSNGEIKTANIDRIPFVFCDIPESLLSDAADYQIALLNLASSDLNYCLKSNYPFYIEQQTLLNNRFTKTGNEDGESAEGGDRIISAGSGNGRAYAMGAEAPRFIAPPTEPLEASMKKQELIKAEMRQIINLSLANLTTQRVSAESKDRDEHGKESGLTFIAERLEKAENELVEIWAMYTGESTTKTRIKYPRKFSARSTSDSIEEATKVMDMVDTCPSLTGQKVMAKYALYSLFGATISTEEWNKITTEIDEAKVISIGYKAIKEDALLGLVSKKTASGARHYPEGDYEVAQEEHSERLAMIQEAQTSQEDKAGARGLPDQSKDPDEGKDEKTASQRGEDGPPKVRGEAS